MFWKISFDWLYFSRKNKIGEKKATLYIYFANFSRTIQSIPNESDQTIDGLVATVVYWAAFLSGKSQQTFCPGPLMMRPTGAEINGRMLASNLYF